MSSPHALMTLKLGPDHPPGVLGTLLSGTPSSRRCTPTTFELRLGGKLGHAAQALGTGRVPACELAVLRRSGHAHGLRSARHRAALGSGPLHG